MTETKIDQNKDDAQAPWERATDEQLTRSAIKATEHYGDAPTEVFAGFQLGYLACLVEHGININDTPTPSTNLRDRAVDVLKDDFVIKLARSWSTATLNETPNGTAEQWRHDLIMAACALTVEVTK